MPRSAKCRRVCQMPTHCRFSPERPAHREAVELTVEEYKKLCGYGRDQKLISRNLLAKLQENVQKAQNARHRSQQEPDEEQPA